MSYPWRGAARPMSRHAMTWAAEQIGCEVAAIRAVWEVEAAGRGFLKDGSLLRRFEPHHFPGSGFTSWRDSLRIGPSRRDRMLEEAYVEHPRNALKATSWGGPQIMGFNHSAAGYATPKLMVEAMADDEDKQVEAFVALIKSWRLDSAIRAHDWQAFEDRYNGGGQGGAYARKIEAAYRRHSGKASPQVVRIGSSGAAVKRLQAALGVKADGSFGPDTDAAVRAFQNRVGLPVDGIVGRRTWAALAQMRDAKPPRQATPGDALADRVKNWAGAAAAVTGAVAGAREALPEDSFAYVAVGLALVAVAALILRRVRS